MTRAPLFLALIPLLSSLGCADDDSLDTCVTPRGVLTANGEHMQGSTIQGIQMQGMETQGMESQGMESQGEHEQGEHIQGLNLAQPATGVMGDGALVRELRLEGATLVGVAEDGRALVGEDFVGARLLAEAGEAHFNLDVTSAARDAEDPSIVHYTLEHAGKSLCADGETLLFVDGSWDETGAHRPSSAEAPSISFACESGVIHKCIRWGYRPWVEGEPLHQACTRMARADYCGDGVPFTHNGTTIDVFDVHAIQSPTGDAEFEFEAGWGPSGAVCVSKPRYHTIGADGREVLPWCWQEKPSCSDWDSARTLGAELGDASKSMVQYLCE